MRKILFAVAALLMGSSTFAAEDFSKQVSEMVSKSDGIKRQNLEKRRDAFQGKTSDGGTAITKAEYLIVKEEFDNVIVKKSLTGKESVEFSPLWDKFQDELAKVKAMPRTSIKEKAVMCVALAKMYQARAFESGNVKLENNLTPDFTVKFTTNLKAPNIYFTYADEIDLITSCAFAEYHVHNSNLANGTVFDMGKMLCEGCSPFWSAATFGVITQKLDEKTYVLKDIKMTGGMHIRNTFLPHDSYILKTDLKYSDGNAYVWAVYGGLESRKSLAGFDKDVPVLYDLGNERTSAIFARFFDARDYLNTFFKNQATCVWQEFRDLDNNYIKLGCYPKPELKKIGNYHEWPK